MTDAIALDDMRPYIDVKLKEFRAQQIQFLQAASTPSRLLIRVAVLLKDLPTLTLSEVIRFEVARALEGVMHI